MGRARGEDRSGERLRARERAALYRRNQPAFARWAAGYGVIAHEDLTQVRVHDWVELLRARGGPAPETAYAILAAADRIASATMWLVVHATYARAVHLDGRALAPEEFKPEPEGHTGGSLNMAIAYTGYLAANALSGLTRGWLMGQGHCVVAVDGANVLVGNTGPAHGERYDLSDAGLTRFVRDFYSMALRPDGTPDAPLGSHVNVHTAGGLIEGGYLGFAELLYVHMPLPGERLVAFLSDGALEEQRGSDWAPRWWRAEDSGLVAPVLIANGRRIDGRTTAAQQGGGPWLHRHLRLNGFDPIDVDGRDPAAVAWAIQEMEERLGAHGRAAIAGRARYPVPLPYAIAEVEKGFGFPGAGTNLAHNLPLGAVPARDADAARRFADGARRLWVPPAELRDAVTALCNHDVTGRPRERDHALTRRAVAAPALPEPAWRRPAGDGGGDGDAASPMAAIDDTFLRVVRANPGLRPRVGNPDELRSNRMEATLDALRHRVTDPEPGVAEAIDGAVITVLNEEAVACAALGNKGGLNLVVTYEAFGVKMLGAIRQELIFARQARAAGAPPAWLSVPFVLTSHTWENGKNEQSHQDPTLCEALLSEMADVARVAFPADWNSAAAALRAAYRGRGEIWALVVPKRPLPDRFTAAQAEELVARGGLRLRGSGGADERLVLIAVGGYQLGEALAASDRLRERAVPHALVYLLEPGRFRAARDEHEAAALASAAERDALFPPRADLRVFLTHTRPGPLRGALAPLITPRTHVLGYLNHGGTLSVEGMLRVNRCTRDDALAAAADLLAPPR